MKKILMLILALSLTIITASAATFEDMPNDWSTNALQSAVDNGLLAGSGNKLLPKNNLTRAQMATILVRALGATEKGDISSFTDVPADAWYHDAMAISYKMGIFKGSGNGKLNPNNPITRQEAFVVLSRAFSLTAPEIALDKFTDSTTVADWAQKEIAGLVVNGYVGGSNGKLNPKSNITRAEFAQVMYNLVKTYCDNAEDLKALGTVEGNVIIRGADIKSLKDVTVNGDLIIGDGAVNNFSFTDVTINGRVIIRAKGSFSFDGSTTELVLIPANSDVMFTAGSAPKTITIVESTSSYEVLVSNGGSSSPGSGYNPNPNPNPNPDNDPDTNEDIWTKWH